jgi:ubiquinone/menaquinone biosynthesis C-methylase UbiE
MSSDKLEHSVAFDRAADYYDATRGYPPGVDTEVAAFIAQSAALSGTERALEIGVGTGRIAVPLAPHAGAYYGVDLAIPMMQKLREKDLDKRVKVTQGDIQQLPFAPHSFDLAVAVHILHLIPDPAKAVNELSRVLKPGGFVLHCGDERDESVLSPLRDAWEAVIERHGQAQRRWKTALESFSEMGWSDGGHFSISHTRPGTAEEFTDRYRNRIFSHSWLVSDDVWREGVAAVEAALVTHFPDPHAPLDIPVSFHVNLWRRPD